MKIEQPTGNALKMSDLCRKILEDAKENKLHEPTYCHLLEGFDFKRKDSKINKK